MDPSLCAKGCGFFGLPENRNMCSKCYRDFLKEDLANQAAKVMESLKIKDGESSKTSKTNETSLRGKCDRKRCKSCNKKVGLLGFECRCGDMFCGVHRYPEVHSCEVDFKVKGRDVLAKQNPICKADKLGQRI